MWTQISQHISETTGKSFKVERQKSVSGGCINQGYCLIKRNGTNPNY